MKVNFCNQALRAAHCRVSLFSYNVNQLGKWVNKKAPIAALVALIAAGCWVTAEEVAPQVAQADTDRIESSLICKQNETYESLLERAQTSALKFVNQSFDQDALITNVSVMITAQNHGAIAPVLFLEVERNQWLSDPALQRWVRYFRSSRSLLGFKDDDVAPTTVESTATPRIISNPETETITPTATTSNQTPTSSTRSGSQLPNTSATTTPPTDVSPGIPSTTTFVGNVVTPITTPLNNAPIINNPTTIRVLKNSGLTPRNNPVPGAIRLIPNNSTNLPSPVPNTTIPNQNFSPNGISPTGL